MDWTMAWTAVAQICCHKKIKNKKQNNHNKKKNWITHASSAVATPGLPQGRTRATYSSKIVSRVRAPHAKVRSEHETTSIRYRTMRGL